jgi:hypothetical protein
VSRPWRNCLLGLTLPLLAVSAQAQPDTEDPDWYRVEILVFANLDPESALSETWPLLPALAYPPQLQRLLRGSERQAADTPFLLNPLEQQLPALPCDLRWDSSIEALEQEWTNKQRYRRPNIVLEPLVELDVPVPFTLLNEQQQEFRTEHRRLERSRDINVLFHQTWIQPIRGKNESLPILLESEIERGDYPALQGSIALYSSRYLHLETNLWLNTDGRYLEHEWTMPLPPMPPSEEKTAQLFKLDVGATWLAQPAPVMEVAAELEALADESAELAQPAVELVTTRPGTEVPSADYAFRHAIKLQQRRRMRSSELHYIDHPMLGVLIKVTRYEFRPFTEAGLTDPNGPATRP